MSSPGPLFMVPMCRSCWPDHWNLSHFLHFMSAYILCLSQASTGLVAPDTICVVIPQDIPVAHQAMVTVVAEHRLKLKFLGYGDLKT